MATPTPVFAEDIRASCDFYHFDSVRIVTHDFGAVWMQRFARLYPGAAAPERVKAEIVEFMGG